MKNASNGKKQDMGSGSIPKLLAQLAIPAVVAQIINLLYNIVDRIYIGHLPEIGGAALTGVGLFTPILMLITAFAMLAGAGGAPRAAIAMGQGNKEKAEQILGNCYSVLMILAVILTAVFYFTCPTLLRWFGASDATLPYAVEYARIYVLGSIFVLTVMGMNTFITTQGFAKISMLTTVIGAVINIVLDPIFIFLLDMGVKGAALATVMSQGVGALWIIRFLTGKQTILRLKKENMRIQPAVIGPCLALGISTFVMVSVLTRTPFWSIFLLLALMSRNTNDAISAPAANAMIWGMYFFISNCGDFAINKIGIIPFYIVINYIFRGVLSPLYSFSMSYISIPSSKSSLHSQTLLGTPT